MASRKGPKSLSGRSSKAWPADVLQALGVEREDDGRYLIRTAGGTLHYADDGRSPKMKADAGTTRELWPDPRDVAGDVAVVVEGEPDAITAHALNLPAIGVPGAGKYNPEWPARIAAGRRHVYLIADSDDVGRTRMRRLAERIATVADPFVYVIDFAPERDDGYDLSDVVADFDLEGAREVVERTMERAAPWEAPPPPPAAAPSAERVAVWTRASDVRIRPVRFLWKPWLPLGKVTILAGAPGQGKSQLTAYMAADTTRAGFYDTDVEEAGAALIMTAEDDLADTTVPRLIAAGADLSRVSFVNMRRTLPGGITTDGLIRLPGDVDTLHARVRAGDVRLAVLDPVASFVGREHSTYINQDVRDVLDPLVWLAAHYGVAIVLVLHLNKSEAKSWAAKIAESHAFQAVARTVLVLAPDPDDEDGERGTEKIMAATKANVVGTTPALKLRVEPRTVIGDDGEHVSTSVVVPYARSTIAADDLLADSVERGARRRALEFLLEALADGPMASKDLQREAKSAGVGWRSVERCYREVCKPARPKEARGVWWYELQERHLPTSGGHVINGLRDEGASKSVDSHSAIRRGMADTDSEPNGQGQLGGHDGLTDLEAYRRHRDAMLGERWEDDDE
jgi:AAA domain-containing protein